MHVVFVFTLSVMLYFLCLCQDVVYESLQSVVDWFREAVGIPMEKKYNTVLFGGMSDCFNTSYVELCVLCHCDQLNIECCINLHVFQPVFQV